MPHRRVFTFCHAVDGSVAELWWAETTPLYLEDSGFPFHSGFVGCGLVGVNLSRAATRARAAYGSGLERVDRHARALGSYDGSLRYEQLA